MTYNRIVAARLERSGDWTVAAGHRSMNAESISRAAKLWRQGRDTIDIGGILDFPEAVIANHLGEIRLVAAAQIERDGRAA